MMSIAKFKTWSIVAMMLAACWSPASQAQAPKDLAPAVAVEAEDFTIERGWKVVKLGEGNYAVDIIGFSHTSGERFLSVDKADTTASAYKDITVPVAGPYHLWVRYEYMPFTDTRFKAIVEQNGKVVAEGVIGAHDNLRIAFQQQELTVAQYDPPWGNEGLNEELVKVPHLEQGAARIRLVAVDQPQVEGRTADRYVDLLYLTSDTEDNWRKKLYTIPFYRILDAFRDTIGPRYEVRFTNRGDKAMNVRTSHYYNRNQFYDRQDPQGSATNIEPGASSDWLPMAMQDTSHFGMARFTPSVAQPFTVAVRPAGGGDTEATVESSRDWVGIYLPPYPNRDEKAVSVNERLEAVLKALKESPAPGRTPTQPLNYGWTVPASPDSEYGRLNAQLWATLGMRTYVSGSTPSQDLRDYFTTLGVPPNRSLMAMLYRNPPTDSNIAAAKERLTASGDLPLLRRFDYGDEIAFSEWVSGLVSQQRVEQNRPDAKPEHILQPMWQAWLKEHRPGYKPEDYWLGKWGALDPAQLKPDSSAAAAKEKPKLYVDSVIFYEDSAIAYVAQGAAKVRAELGKDVLTGANYSGYPFYTPSTTMYVKWFRDGAADFGRHSEYFWQLGQVTPMVNGLFAEYFRAGLRYKPQGRVIQYTMPHSPGNTDASFRRTAFTHLAHGVKMLDYFGMGMNETFTENYIDQRDVDRFIAIRDINYAMGLVDDVLEESHAVASPVALLASESTERWDWSGVASDFAGHNYGAGFRNARLSYHQDRLGIYTALAFAGISPDIVIERDLTADVLKQYKVLYIVGDSLPAEVVPAVEQWVRDGGVLMATAGAGMNDIYGQRQDAFDKLFGLTSRTVEERDRFMRTSQEVPFLKPIEVVKIDLPGLAVSPESFPALAMHERIKGGEIDAERLVRATFADGSPAAYEHSVGSGRVIYTATLPGLAYLYTGLTTPRIEVPDRAAGAHRAVNTYDPAAESLILHAVRVAEVATPVSNSQTYIDARLLVSKDGKTFMLPVSNYHANVGQDVTFTITPPQGAGKPVKVTSAFAGELPVKVADGMWTFSVPKLGYGDMVRIDAAE